MLEKNPANDTKGLLSTQNIKLKDSQWVKAPTRLELFTVRLMIVLGLVSMGFFLNSVLSLSVRGFAPLYWMLIATFVFICLKTLHEWYHYYCITVPETPVATKIYTVDIFTTFCAGEPYEMIEETLTAILAITYPHKTYLCDEADDPYLRQFCAERNIIHVTRKEKKNAKAGNINNALAQSSGELCVVLDPDHVPFPNFLDPIVSHFDNPEVGYVQIVQAYKNMGDGFIARGAAQQTYQFYGPMMMTMNRYGTVLAIGANCTFRRTALESIGGHAAGLAEDLHTSMQLHAKGWKSVYVPAILARGLVPSTLSAYYQQQLKWSRGVFDLLVIAYPKLFKHFTWRQKLHYGVIPLHYLSGIIFLINFLIPILSLFFGVSPMDINLAEFALVALPFMAAVILIRHFVQWWVMEDRERGFHILGGLLMTGTWWIYILGLVYTILRKKVPYIPTPKDGIEKNNWPLNIPNFAVLGLSLAAIIYGLYTDWNPYTIIMSVFAGMNCMIMLFNIVASRQQQYRVLKARYPLFNRYMNWIQRLKVNFWFIRRRIYTGVRSTALMISILLTCSIVYYANYGSRTSLAKLPVEKTSYLFGIFAPDNDKGLTSLKSVKQFNTHFDIVSHYIPWGNESQCFLPLKKIDSTYQIGAIPMITWEPWQNLFDTLSQSKSPDQKVFVKIAAGHYDRYIREFSDQIKSLNKPVYLRFAHEADNPQYPWSASGNNTAQEFKDAWRYIHQFFSANRVYNVIWVWNPWQADAVKSYFPGKSYVDWIGVTNLNYSRFDTEKEWRSMEDLYRPFHRQAIFRSGIPVMLAEMGSLNSAGSQNLWFKQAFEAAKRNFPEIKGFVLFNSPFDKNVPLNNYDQGTVLNWGIQNPDSVVSFLTGRNSASDPVPELRARDRYKADNVAHAGQISNYKGVRGVNYTKGLDWDKSRKAFTMKEMIADLNEMKGIGINTIKWKGPGIYDRNILNAAKELDINIHYSFGVPDDLDFVKDTSDLKVLSSKILRSINSLKNKEKIVSWNIGNTVFYKLGRRYIKPDLIYQQDAYLFWLQKLVQEIKQIDPGRDVTMDVAVSQEVPEVIDRIRQVIPEIDSYGLVMNDVKAASQLKDITAPYFLSSVSVPAYMRLKNIDAGAFITDWQDVQASDLVGFDGLKDHWGRRKIALLQLSKKWKNTPYAHSPRKIKILKPSHATVPGAELTYYAITPANSEWKIITPETNDLQLEWKLVRYDYSGKPISIKEIEKGPQVKVIIPENPSAYQLYLYVLKGNVVVDIIVSDLNTPILYPRKNEI